MEHLDETSPEYEHTEFIHDELARIALRCGEHLVISPTQLNELKTRFDNEPECFKNQHLLWHGSLKKQPPRKHDSISQRYIILLTNCILVCNESGRKLRIDHELPMEEVTIKINESRRVPIATFYSSNEQQLTPTIHYSFHVNARVKSFEFLVDKEADREKWMTKIGQAIEAFQKRTPAFQSKEYFHFH
jgi:hypothetical protein